jgi:hypothetical protein
VAGDVPDAVVADVARRLVTQAAPQELPLFRATSEAYFADPEETLARRGGKDEMLGFGVEAAVILITPVALDVAKRVVAWVADQVGDSLKKEGSEKIGEVVHDLFDRDGESAEKAEALSDEQLREVRQVAFDRARELDLPEDRAGVLADAVVGSLATR